MTDSVRCNRDSNNTLTCEVHIDSDFTTVPAGTPPASTPPAEPARSPAVSALVGAYSRVIIPRADAPIVTTKSLQACVSAELSLPIAFATTSYLGPLAGFKAGYDTGQCLADEQQKAVEAATKQNGVKACEGEGGAVTGIVDHRIFCDMTAVAK